MMLQICNGHARSPVGIRLQVRKRDPCTCSKISKSSLEWIYSILSFCFPLLTLLRYLIISIYRDTVEIMQSHTNVGERAEPGKVCTRNYRLSRSQQPPTTMKIIDDAGKSLKGMSLTEYCAAHLAGLSLSAVQEYDRSSKDTNHPGGRFVNYKQMPDVVWETIFPEHFGLKPESVESMQKTAGVYSKGRGAKANREWTEDSSLKHETASPEVIQAAKVFASKVYNRMKELSGSS